MENKLTFEEIVEQNKRRIHYHIHRLRIKDPHNEFYQEGLCAMWNAYESYQADKGPMATYFNFIIRNRLIDLLRKKTRENENNQRLLLDTRTRIDDGNRLCHGEASYSIPPVTDVLLNDPFLLENLRPMLTEKQWKWLYFHIIKDMPLKQLAIQENTTVDAVKSWGKQARKRLRNRDFLDNLISN